MEQSNPALPVRILVVDDEAAQMHALCDTLQDQGFAATGFTDAGAALAALQDGRFEILLTDLSMPDTDGISLLRAARDRDPDLVGIIMTGEGSIASAVEAMKAGAFDYILKPFRLRAILPVLERALTMRRLRIENVELQQRLQQHAVELEAANRGLNDQAVELEAARLAAEEGARVKAVFLATMSHEIRTPLNAILGMVELLAATPLEEQQHEYVEIARTSSEHLLGLINDVLDFSRADAGRLELEQQPFNLLVCVEESLSLVATRAYAKNLELACDYDPALPVHILGDAGRMRQVLVNLLTNAVKFTAHGEVVVTVTGKVRGNACDFRVAVRDTGIGVAADKQHRLFQAFSQVDASTTREYGGTGLGLAICKRIVEAMGGSIGVDSHEGDGSTFHFNFTAGTAAVPEQRPPFRPELQGLDALVVSATAANRRVLQHHGEVCGMGVTGVATAHEALARLQDGARFDVAVIDHLPAQVDALVLAQALRRQRDAGQLRIYALTAPGAMESQLRDSGIFHGVFTKPIRQSTLYDLGLAMLPDASVAPARRSQKVRTQDPGPAAALRILLVEDNLVNQRVAQLMLRKLGQQVDVVNNGREALTAVSAGNYDVVLMDMLMPEMDGLEATRRIRAQLPGDRQPRIVAMTANASVNDRDRCLAAGMDDYISKPISLDKLAHVIRLSGQLRQRTDSA
ncbi:MAG: multi-sensor hybrid histidine kinase [Moraxellaceae bacterium]|nr:multi-sensor hybrid histidine kinase [Moraxellaceae bacterium]